MEQVVAVGGSQNQTNIQSHYNLVDGCYLNNYTYIGTSMSILSIVAVNPKISH